MIRPTYNSIWDGIRRITFPGALNTELTLISDDGKRYFWEVRCKVKTGRGGRRKRRARRAR